MFADMNEVHDAGRIGGKRISFFGYEGGKIGVEVTTMEHLHSLSGVVPKFRFGEEHAQGCFLLRWNETALSCPFLYAMNGSVQIIGESQWMNT